MCECGKPKRNYYNYYDTPDGCDVDKKIFVATRYGVIVGLVASTYDVLMYSHAMGMGPIIKRYMLHTVPLALMGATFAAVSNGVQKARKKDDHLNYFLGGMACGPILAAYLGSGHAVLLGGLLLGIAGMVKKDSIERDYEFFPYLPRPMNMINSWRNDYTLVKDPRDVAILKKSTSERSGKILFMGGFIGASAQLWRPKCG